MNCRGPPPPPLIDYSRKARLTSKKKKKKDKTPNFVKLVSPISIAFFQQPFSMLEPHLVVVSAGIRL